REELVTMLWRYMGSPAASADLGRFGDGASVSGWASGAMQWAVSAGLLEGSGGNLNPNGTATRAEVAAILMRFCENVVK
ncbi:MAG: S-layer homology domain-containing protein, partial [Oscillospiraceae bacterium]|nr:S-layer homology domain-containing protein [Oscillospiraceae bacterium]